MTYSKPSLEKLKCPLCYRTGKITFIWFWWNLTKLVLFLYPVSSRSLWQQGQLSKRTGSQTKKLLRETNCTQSFILLQTSFVKLYIAFKLDPSLRHEGFSLENQTGGTQIQSLLQKADLNTFKKAGRTKEPTTMVKWLIQSKVSWFAAL